MDKEEVSGEITEFRFYCTKCTRKFRTIEKRDIHETGHTNNNKCAKCNTQLKTIHNYEKHVEYCLTKTVPVFICNICGKELSTKITLNGHLSTHKKTEEEKEENNDDYDYTVIRINSEKKIKLNPFIYPCTQCPRKFRSRTKCQLHEFGHRSNNKCGKCNRQLQSSVAYEKHTAQCEYKTFTCEICGKFASSKTNLNSHMSTHGDFNCEICDLQFDQKSKYKSHMLIHLTGNVVECNVCGKKFRSSNFYNHQRIHLGLKKLKCEICGSKFIKESNLESHYNLKHSLEYPMKDVKLVGVENSSVQEEDGNHAVEGIPYTQLINYYDHNNLNNTSWPGSLPKQY